MNRIVKAALLNAFVLPGLGQLLLGRKVKGFICIMLINLILLGAVFVVLKTLSPLIAAQISGGSKLSVSMLTENIDSSSMIGKAILFSFVIIWSYALIDLFKGNDEVLPDE